MRELDTFDRRLDGAMQALHDYLQETAEGHLKSFVWTVTGRDQSEGNVNWLLYITRNGYHHEDAHMLDQGGEHLHLFMQGAEFRIRAPYLGRTVDLFPDVKVAKVERIS